MPLEEEKIEEQVVQQGSESTEPVDVLETEEDWENLSYLSLIHISEPTRPY